ncbi:hypothetical protein K1X84_16790 [bacterium]|nr:hypothetical protein [bacterium]
MENNIANEACKNCGKLGAEGGYIVPLCADCRTTLSNFPVPAWVKWTSFSILLVVGFSAIQFPEILSTVIALKRAEKAEKNHEYKTAAIAYASVTGKYPNAMEAQAGLCRSYYYNGEFEKTFQTFEILNGKVIDNDLLPELDRIYNELSALYIPAADIQPLYAKTDVMPPSMMIDTLSHYLMKNPDNVFIRLDLANRLYDAEEFEHALELIQPITDRYQSPTIWLFKAAILRELKRFDLATDYVHKAIEQNRENGSAFSALARIELKRKNDAEAIRYAEQANALSPDEAVVIYTMALICHYQGDKNCRDEFMRKFVAINAKSYIQTLDDIFANKKVWR